MDIVYCYLLQWILWKSYYTQVCKFLHLKNICVYIYFMFEEQNLKAPCNASIIENLAKLEKSVISAHRFYFEPFKIEFLENVFHKKNLT